MPKFLAVFQTYPGNFAKNIGKPVRGAPIRVEPGSIPGASRLQLESFKNSEFHQAFKIRRTLVNLLRRRLILPGAFSMLPLSASWYF